MAFLSDAKSFSASLTKDGRVAFAYLMENAVGCAHAKAWPDVEAHLIQKGINMSKNTFQASVIKPSREGKVFIGSTDVDFKGYFIIAKLEDADVVRAWYKKRIAKERSNLDNLEKLIKEEWNV